MPEQSVGLKGFYKTKQLKILGEFTKLLFNKDLAPDVLALAKTTERLEVTIGLWKRSQKVLPKQ